MKKVISLFATLIITIMGLSFVFSSTKNIVNTIDGFVYVPKES